MSSLASVSTAKKDTSISFPRVKGDPPAFYRKCCPEDQVNSIFVYNMAGYVSDKLYKFMSIRIL